MTDGDLQYYDLESYLFATVHERFHREGKLDAFDLMSIVIWKAERAKSRIANRLIRKVQTGSLKDAAERFTRELFEARTAQERLIIAMEGWELYLPMASAILSVLWPEEFTVFDFRACEQLGEFGNLKNLNTRKLWPEYLRYREAVIRAVPECSSLRDKDRVLWARSAARHLVEDIDRNFAKPTEPAGEMQSEPLRS